MLVVYAAIHHAFPLVPSVVLELFLYFFICVSKHHGRRSRRLLLFYNLLLLLCYLLILFEFYAAFHTVSRPDTHVPDDHPFV